MYKQKWFRFLVWSTSVFIFFLNACVLIATLGPGPSQNEVHLWMAGMMQAMHQSLMGYSMQIEDNSSLAFILYSSSQLILPAAIGGLLGGLFYKSSRKYGKKTK